jgi:hypothetical protein
MVQTDFSPSFFVILWHEPSHENWHENWHENTIMKNIAKYSRRHYR